jgi:hypothetical protein
VTLTATSQYCVNLTTLDQLEFKDGEWFNSYEAVYSAGFWRIYL